MKVPEKTHIPIYENKPVSTWNSFILTKIACEGVSDGGRLDVIARSSANLSS